VRRIIVITGFVGLLLSACQGANPQQQFTKGEELVFYNFTIPGSFEEGTYGAAILRVTDGVYRIDVQQGDNTLWWGQWGESYSDVVIEVDVAQITERNENAYGVMCRVRGSVGQPHDVDPTLAAIMEETSEAPEPTSEADITETPNEEEAEATDAATDEAEAEATDGPADEDEAEATDGPADEDEAEATDAPNGEATGAATDEAEAEATEAPSYGEGDGYLFLIQGTGSFAIMRARGRNVVPLVDWTVSDKINIGPARNSIRAVCAGDYLAMYVNDQYVGEATDDTYQSGQVGLVASAANVLGLRVEFDNLSISEARTG
jgi:hypothetical protein